MKVYRFFEVLSAEVMHLRSLLLVPLCLCLVNSVSAQQSGSAASVSRKVSREKRLSRLRRKKGSMTYFPSSYRY